MKDAGGTGGHGRASRRGLAAAPVGGGGAWRDNESTRRAHISDPAPPVWRAPEDPEGTGGLRDRPLRAAGSRVAISRAAGSDGARNTSGTASNKLNREFRLRRRRGRLAGGPPPTGAPSSPAPQQNQAAPGTPAEPQTQTQTQTQTRQSGPEPLGSGPPSMLSGDEQRATRVSSARPPCRPCRSSRR